MVASELTASAIAMRSTPVSGDESGSSLPKPLAPLQNLAATSQSPYIRDQAKSLVSWQLFNDEAIERSRKENKLIFLHIGYKACHCKSRDRSPFRAVSTLYLIANSPSLPPHVARDLLQP